MRTLLVLGLVVSLFGCGHTLVETAADLRSDDVDTRAGAAECIEDAAEGGEELPREVVDALLLAAARETDAEAREDMMVALGHSGDVRAKEVLDAYARTDDPEQRASASEALQAWAKKSGRYPASHTFAPDWPYGTEAYPAKLK
jgi:hypothetical protein